MVGEASLLTWSVVIPTRNRADMLCRAIESCLNQTLPCEVVVIDEASSDDTAERVAKFPGVRYKRNETPLGHARAANLGMRLAGGSWIKTLDDDDWLDVRCLELFSKAIHEAELRGFSPVLVTGRVHNVDDKEQPLGLSRSVTVTQPGVLRSEDLLQMMLVDQAPLGTPVQVAHRRDAGVRVGGWDEQRDPGHQHGDETAFWIRLAALGDAVFIPEVIGYRTIWAGGSQSRIDHLSRFRSNVDLKDRISQLLRHRAAPQSIRSYAALHWAMVAYRDHKPKDALRLGMEWLKAPWSARNIVRRQHLKDLRQRITEI